LSSVPPSLTPELGSKLARLALSHITREYPNVVQHVLSGPTDVRGPRELHPIFFGSFDWHSCVHGYWLLATFLRLFPENAESGEIRELFEAYLTPSNVRGELDYLGQPLRKTFERPYGWAWVLMLSAELNRHGTDDGKRWSNTLTPLADEFVRRFLDFLPKATYPTRVGTHFNSAFALTLALEYSEVMNDKPLRKLLANKARAWYRNDVDCQAWEPGGDDFLSPALMEAECMRRVLSANDFQDWLERFLPRLGARQPMTLFEPAIVSDRTDGKIAHLDGLNLSRGWCWRSLAKVWPDTDPRRAIALDAADVHLAAGLSQVAGDYMGEHWLATFALLALI
jgi:Protein of unknown function (DUF2891)